MVHPAISPKSSCIGEEVMCWPGGLVVISNWLWSGFRADVRVDRPDVFVITTTSKIISWENNRPSLFENASSASFSFVVLPLNSMVKGGDELFENSTSWTYSADTSRSSKSANVSCWVFHSPSQVFT